METEKESLVVLAGNDAEMSESDTIGLTLVRTGKFNDLDYPRIHGEQVEPEAPIYNDTGSPPYTRGTAKINAGSTSVIEDHPRIHGEQ